MEVLRLCESDYRFMSVIWDEEPVASGRLVELCRQRMGWKKSTTYTTLKKLCEKGFADNQQTIVTSRIPREQVQEEESRYFVDRTFGGSLPGFLTAFLNNKRLAGEEIEKLKRLIEEHRE